MKRIFIIHTLLYVFFFKVGHAQFIFSPTTALPVSLSTGVNWTAGSGCANPGTKAQISFNVTGLPTLLTSTFTLAQIRLTFSTSAPCGSNLRDLRLILKYQPSGPCFIFYEGNPTPATSGSGASTLTNSTDVTMYLRDNPSCANLSWVDFDSNWDLDRTTSGNTGFFRAGCNACGATQANTLTLAQAFNNINPNGTWTIYAQYNGTAGSEPCITAANLYFGNPLVTDRRPDGDHCSTAISYTGSAFCAMTNTKTASTTMPGNASTDGVNNRNTFGTIGGGTCAWNAANNNDVWIKLTPGAGYFCISISGLSNQLQSIVVEPTNADNDNDPCTANASRSPNDLNWTVKSCPNPGAIYNGVTSGTLKNQQHCFASEAGKSYYLIVDGNGGVESPFYVSGLTGTTQATLSDNILKLNGTLIYSGNLLQWNSNIPNESVTSYELERSFNNQNFHSLHIKTQNSAAQKEFDYLDKLPLSGNNYYRVKVIMKDGAYMYSSVVMLKGKSNNLVTVFPNPVVNMLNISSAFKIQSLNIFNPHGQLVFSQNLVGLQSFQISTQSWAKGQYVLVITDPAGNMERIKVLK